MRFAGLFRAPMVEPGRVRQEIFSLGDRHRGDALGGALLELEDASLTGERRALLDAVVQHLAPTGQNGRAGGRAPVLPARYGPSNFIYLAVIATTWVWIALVAMSLLAA